MSQQFEIDTPLSVNAMYRNVAKRGRVKTTAYKNWIKGQLKALVAQKAKPQQTPVAVTLLIPNATRGDCDNRMKGALDLLVRAGIVPDDSGKYVRQTTVAFHAGEMALLSIYSLPEAA